MPLTQLVQVRFISQIWKIGRYLTKFMLGDHRPARAVAGVAELHFGAALEIEAVAVSA